MPHLPITHTFLYPIPLEYLPGWTSRQPEIEVTYEADQFDRVRVTKVGLAPMVIPKLYNIYALLSEVDLAANHNYGSVLEEKMDHIAADRLEEE